MAWQNVAWALRRSPMMLTEKGLPDSTAKTVLVVLCEYSDVDGSNAFPSVPVIEYESSLDERTVRRALDRLEAAGLITAVGKIGRDVTIWQVNVQLARSESALPDFMAGKDAKKAAEAERARRNREKAKAKTAPVVTAAGPEGLGYIDVQREISASAAAPRTDSLSVRTDTESVRTDSLPVRTDRVTPLPTSYPPSTHQAPTTGGTLPPDPLRNPTASRPGTDSQTSPSDGVTQTQPLTTLPTDRAGARVRAVGVASVPALRLIDGGDEEAPTISRGLFPAVVPDDDPVGAAYASWGDDLAVRPDRAASSASAAAEAARAAARAAAARTAGDLPRAAGGDWP